MSSAKSTRRMRWAPQAAASPLAVVLAWQVHCYGSPLEVTVAVGLATWLGLTTVLTDVFTAAATTTYRCPEPGCDFTVGLLHVDAAEYRRWQEAAADHPND